MGAFSKTYRVQKCKEVLDAITLIHNKTEDPKKKKDLANRIAVLTRTIQVEKEKNGLIISLKMVCETVIGVFVASFFILYKIVTRAPI